MELTEREQQAYDFIVNYFKDNGFSPSYQEIAEGIYYGSATSVSPIIQKLKDKGYIELPLKATARAIKVVGMEHAIVQAIPIPDNATNGDMIKAMFPQYNYEEINYKLRTSEDEWEVSSKKVRMHSEQIVDFESDWWNSPYKGDKND